MKKGSFSGLLYREYYLCKKNLLTYFLIFAGAALLGFLFLLSFHCGNLGKLIAYALADSNGELAPEAGERLESIRSSLFLTIKVYPAAMMGGLITLTADIAAKDTKTLWQRFERCTPVTPLKFAAVKTAVNALAAAFTLVLGASYMFFIGLASGEYLTCGELSFFVLAAAAFAMFAVIGQVFILLFSDRDKGMLASLFILIISVWLLANAAGAADSEENGLDLLLGASERILPFTPLIFAGLFALLFAAMYFIYKRREK